MSFIATIAGQSFTLPTEGDENWGSQTSEWMAAVSTDLLQKSGGNFTLTADVNFGANFGLKSAYFTSRTANAATAGALRVARADVINWRNEANDGNLSLGVDSSNRLTYNGEIVQTNPAGVVPVNEGGTGFSSYTVGDTLYASGATTLSKLAIGTANYVLVSTGTAPSWALLVNANIDAAAAIAYSKLSLGDSIVNADINSAAAIDISKLAAVTASRALVSDGSGFVSAATTTATEIGYVNGVTSAIQTQLNAKQASGNYITALTGDVTASGPGSVAATLAATTNGTLVTLSAAAGVAIHGTNTNDNAAAGYVGEYVQSVVSSQNFPTSSQWGDLTSISLTAGDWDVTALMASTRNGATVSSLEMGISTTSGNSSSGLVYGSNYIVLRPSSAGADEAPGAIPGYRISVSGTTTIYFKFYSGYTGGPPQAYGRLSARRVR